MLGVTRRYFGYYIYHEFNHYVVVAPDGEEWSEDTITDAYKTIDEIRGYPDAHNLFIDKHKKAGI